MEGILKIYCDGGSRGNPGPAASAFVVEENGKIIFKRGTYVGNATNNVAEYRAVLEALKWLSDNHSGTAEVLFVLDSELVSKQLSGIFKIKNENLRNYFFSIKEIEKNLGLKISYSAVPRAKNALADFLVNKTLDEKDQ